MGPSGIFNLPGPYRNGGRREGRIGIPTKKQLSDPSTCNGVVYILALSVLESQMIYIIMAFYVSI